MLALTQEPTQSTPPVGSSHPVTRLPITAQGLSSYRALNALEQHYGRVQDVVNIGIAPTEQQGRQLRAGESIGTALMLGDIQMGYIGTATLVQGSQVFAFGHPLLFAGPTNIPLTQAPIVTTTRGEFPQKIGSFGAVIGAIHQDRSAGVLAELGSVPLTVHMQFTVQDTDRQRTTTVTTQAANIKSELPFLTFIGVLESMQRAMNRVGSGSATWQWRLTLTNTSEPIQATASEEDATDIGFLVAISGESLVSQALAAVVNLKSIELTAVVSSQPISE